MIGLLALFAVGLWVVLYKESIEEIQSDIPQKLSTKLDKLWDIVQDSFKEHRYLRAEKALLTILRVDEKNATAYNRLGILYASQKSYKDAIECFEIAQSLEPSASSLHNVGLIYLETGKFDRAAQAFEQALALEDDHASRYIAYAKVQEKLGHIKKMFDALHTAARLEPSLESYHILADAYANHGREEEAEKIRTILKKAANKKKKPVRQIVKPKRRVIM